MLRATLHSRQPVLARFATIGCGLTLAVLSWTPAKYMVRTGVLTRHQEHFLAYFVSGSLIAALWSRHPARVGVLLTGLAGLLDLGQAFAPGRRPGVDGFAASALGALVGVGLTAVLRKARTTR